MHVLRNRAAVSAAVAALPRADPELGRQARLDGDCSDPPGAGAPKAVNVHLRQALLKTWSSPWGLHAAHISAGLSAQAGWARPDAKYSSDLLLRPSRPLPRIAKYRQCLNTEPQHEQIFLGACWLHAWPFITWCGCQTITGVGLGRRLGRFAPLCFSAPPPLHLLRCTLEISSTAQITGFSEPYASSRPLGHLSMCMPARSSHQCSPSSIAAHQ